MTHPSPAPRPRRVLLAAVLVALTLLLTPANAQALPERAGTPRVLSHNQRIVINQVNRARTSRDRRAISTNGTMNRNSQNWAAHLRSCQCLQHRAGPFGAPRGWCAAAENVGRGSSLSGIQAAFMNSPAHRSNVLNRRWTDLGVGVARDRGGEYFVVHAFADLAC
jgi:uncharacterized protein YkwD